MTTETPRLAFGLNDALPEGTEHAWGARFIVSQDGHVDLPHDRQDVISPDPDAKRVFLEDLMAAVTMNDLMDRIKSYLEIGVIHTREAGRHILWDEDGITIIGDTNASAGYLYVVAFRTTPVVV
jgi:hypothetical protein